MTEDWPEAHDYKDLLYYAVFFRIFNEDELNYLHKVITQKLFWSLNPFNSTVISCGECSRIWIGLRKSGRRWQKSLQIYPRAGHHYDEAGHAAWLSGILIEQSAVSYQLSAKKTC